MAETVGRAYREMNMKYRYTKLGLTLLIGMAGQTALADDEEHMIEAAPDGTVTVSNVAGSVEVSGWSRSEVAVAADLGSGVEELIVERDGDNVLIKVKVPKRNSRNISSDLIIQVPENSSLEVGAVSADIEIADVYGEQRLHVVSGDIVTEAYGEDLQAESVSGDIEIDGDRQSMHVRLSSVSGDIETSQLSGDFEATSVSGDLVIADGSYERVQANTVNGDLAFRGELQGDGRMDIETINGSVDIDFTGDVSARFDIETFNGGIRNCFGPDSQRTSKYAPGRELKFTEGGGTARVTIRTLNGSLTLCKD